MSTPNIFWEKLRPLVKPPTDTKLGFYNIPPSDWTTWKKTNGMPFSPALLTAMAEALTKITGVKVDPPKEENKRDYEDAAVIWCHLRGRERFKVDLKTSPKLFGGGDLLYMDWPFVGSSRYVTLGFWQTHKNMEVRQLASFDLAARRFVLKRKEWGADKHLFLFYSET